MSRPYESERPHRGRDLGEAAERRLASALAEGVPFAEVRRRFGVGSNMMREIAARYAAGKGGQPA